MALQAEKIPDLTGRLLEFAQLLRDQDYPANPDSVQTALKIARTTNLHDHHVMRHSLRACFCNTPKQWHGFDKLFYVYWFGTEVGASGDENDATPGAPPQDSRTHRMVGLAGTSSDSEMFQNVYGAGDYSALSLADFRFVFNPKEKAAIDLMVDDLATRAKRQTTKKTRIADHGQRVSLPHSIRQSLRYQGALFQLRYRCRRKKLPGFVLLLDISQSMDVYARLFLRFTRKLLSVFETSHAFAFNIALIDLGRGFYQIEESDFEDTINTASQGWVGGTRIAASLRTFNADYQHLVKSNTTVVIFSDGCDTAPPEELALETASLARRARRIVWVNPLLGRFPEGHIDPKMTLVLPHISQYLSAHNLPALRELQRALLS